jgi:GTP-binding protein HflX
VHIVKQTERAVVAAVFAHGADTEAELAELRELVATAGAEIVAEVTQERGQPHPVTYLGKCKLDELLGIVKEEAAELVIVDEDLSPTQMRNIGDVVKVRVVDRTQLILDIFSQRAHTKEGNLQVELAQLQYLLPRITSVYTRFERQAGGIGIGMRGPGETKLEADRSRIRRNIRSLQEGLEEVRKRRAVQRGARGRMQFPTAALVGYTSAGKSTLLNALSGSDVYVDPKLFATLDPTTRRIELPNGRPILLTDTVGFIRKLPTHLVAAFRATLEETTEADLLLHVVDASHPRMQEQVEAVFTVLEDLGVAGKPIVTVLNKSDLVKDTYRLRDIVAHERDAIYVSARTGDGLPQLKQKIQQVLEREKRRELVPADNLS